MIEGSRAFSSFSIKDKAATIDFYRNVLGLEIVEEEMGLKLKAGGGNDIFIYQKDDHQPASHTVLNFDVEDIDAAVQALKEKGVAFEPYKDLTDEDGIARGKAADMGPDIAWFKDPSGNTLSVLCG